MKNSSCMMETIYLCLVDFCKEPFEFEQEKFDQRMSFTVVDNKEIKFTRDSESVYFFYLDFLVFTISNEDNVNLDSGSVQINSKHGHLTLKRL